MSNKYWLISMASWEPRFSLGIDHLCETNEIIGATVIYSKEYRAATANKMSEAQNVFQTRSIKMELCEIDFQDQVNSFTSIEKHIKQLELEEAGVLLDITTMPREVVWNCCRLLDDRLISSEFLYYPPEKYHDDWLTDDADCPRLVLRSSGITKYGKPTALVIVTGFDAWRTAKPIVHYEPHAVRLGIQTGDQYENIRRNAEQQKELLEPQLKNLDFFDFDSYMPSLGYEQLSEIVQRLLPDYNVLLTSQGPKPSAIACYNVVTSFPEVGLFYVPSRKYNRQYSDGIDISAMVRRSLKFPKSSSIN